jgi:hypothetical protein
MIDRIVLLNTNPQNPVNPVKKIIKVIGIYARTRN